MRFTYLRVLSYLPIDDQPRRQQCKQAHKPIDRIKDARAHNFTVEDLLGIGEQASSSARHLDERQFGRFAAIRCRCSRK